MILAFAKMEMSWRLRGKGVKGYSSYSPKVLGTPLLLEKDHEADEGYRA